MSNLIIRHNKNQRGRVVVNPVVKDEVAAEPGVEPKVVTTPVGDTTPAPDTTTVDTTITGDTTAGEGEPADTVTEGDDTSK